MKQKEISLNSLLIDSDHFLLTDEEIGDNHVATSIETPMREDAFVLSDAEKIEKVEDVINVGDTVHVEINEIDPKGKLSLIPVVEGEDSAKTE